MPSKPSDTVVLSVRVSAEKAAAIDKLAKSTDRSKQWLLEQAVDAYLLSQSWQIEMVEEGLAAADAGDKVPHERVRAWLKSWGKEDELEPPA